MLGPTDTQPNLQHPRRNRSPPNFQRPRHYEVGLGVAQRRVILRPDKVVDPSNAYHLKSWAGRAGLIGCGGFIHDRFFLRCGGGSLLGRARCSSKGGRREGFPDGACRLPAAWAGAVFGGLGRVRSDLGDRRAILASGRRLDDHERARQCALHALGAALAPEPHGALSFADPGLQRGRGHPSAWRSPGAHALGRNSAGRPWGAGPQQRPRRIVVEIGHAREGRAVHDRRGGALGVVHRPRQAGPPARRRQPPTRFFSPRAAPRFSGPGS